MEQPEETNHHNMVSLTDLKDRFPEFDFNTLRNPLAKRGLTIGDYIVRHLQTTWLILESSDLVDSSMIYNLAQNGFSDKTLPFSEKRLSKIQTFSNTEYLEAQDVFLAVKFETREHKELDSCNTVPFTNIHNSPVREGSFGVVRQVQETRGPSGQTVIYAKKTVGLHANPDRREAQLREYRLLEQLPASDHIVQLRASYIQDGKLNMILSPWAETDLQLFLERFDGFDFWKKIRSEHNENEFFGNIFACLAAALHTIHRKNFKHKDLKPANVLLYIDGTTASILPVITDFGLSKKFHDTSRSVAFGGTDYYRPPERRVGRSGDIFALGCIYIELAILKAGQPRRRLNRLVKDGYAAGVADNMDQILSIFPGDTGWWKTFKQLVGKMVAVEPAQRPSAIQVLRNIEEMEGSAGRQIHCTAESFHDDMEGTSMGSEDLSSESDDDYYDDGMELVRFE